MSLTLAPIVDYPTLQAAIAGWVDRTDFAQVAPVLIGLAHSRLNRTLRVHDMLKRSTANITAGDTYVDLPDDVVELKRVVPITSPRSKPLRVMTDDQIAELWAENGTSVVPIAYAPFGEQLILGPPPAGDFTLEVHYFGEIPTLSDVAPTNWLLSKWPEAYLFGALVESAPYLRDDDRMPLWQARFETAVNEIQQASDRKDLAGGRMVNRTRALA